MFTLIRARHRTLARTATLLIAATALGASGLTSCSTDSTNSSVTIAPPVEATSGATSGATVTTVAQTEAGATDAETETEPTPEADEPAIVTFADDITFVADEATTTTQTVSADSGGSLSLTSADGTVFTLDISPGALVEDTEITATVGSVDAGVTGPGAIYSVRFEPEGTRFVEPAHLRIEPTTSLEAGHLLPFSTARDGSDLRIGELSPTGDEILVPHFSIFNAARLVQSIRDLKARFDGPKRDPERDLYNAIAIDVLIRDRDAAAGAPIDVVERRLQESAIAYQDKIVIPLVESSDGSCAAKLKISDKLIRYYQLIVSNGIRNVTDMKATMQTQVRDMYQTCEKLAIADCKAARNPQLLMAFWIGIYTYTGPAGVADASRTIAKDEQRARKICIPIYNVAGGGPEIVISGVIEDLSDAFILKATFVGGVATFVYSPDDDRSGSYTVSGGGGGASVTGSGTYAIAENGDVLTMTQITSACVTISGKCRDQTEVMTLTPK